MRGIEFQESIKAGKFDRVRDVSETKKFPIAELRKRLNRRSCATLRFRVRVRVLACRAYIFVYSRTLALCRVDGRNKEEHDGERFLCILNRTSSCDRSTSLDLALFSEIFPGARQCAAVSGKNSARVFSSALTFFHNQINMPFKIVHKFPRYFHRWEMLYDNARMCKSIYTSLAFRTAS